MDFLSCRLFRKLNLQRMEVNWLGHSGNRGKIKPNLNEEKWQQPPHQTAAVVCSSYGKGHQILEGWFWQPQFRISIFLNALYFLHQQISEEVLMQETYLGMHLGDASGLWQWVFKNRLHCCCLQSFHTLFLYSLQLLGPANCLQVISREPPLQRGKQDSCSHLTLT